MLITVLKSLDKQVECRYWWHTIDVIGERVTKIIYTTVNPEKAKIIKEWTVEEVNKILNDILWKQ